MQGAGNDYVFFNCMHSEIPYPAETAIRLSDRHFSVGGDGMILICKSKIADAKMRIFNADGSEGKTCGNGLRCVAKFLRDGGFVLRNELTIETLSGIVRLRTHCAKNGMVGRVTVDMGKADFSPKAIPVLSGTPMIEKVLTIGEMSYKATCVSTGNPHCVIFSTPPQNFSEIGSRIERHEIFPERVNVEFSEIVSPCELRVRVWERGSGETLACGSGACAVVAAATVSGRCREGDDVFVRLRGGTLIVKYTKDKILMTGDACLAYTGVIEI